MNLIFIIKSKIFSLFLFFLVIPILYPQELHEHGEISLKLDEKTILVELQAF